MEKSIGCGVTLAAFLHAGARLQCTRDSGNLCRQCQIKRDVLDELAAALADTALLDTLERMQGGLIRASLRTQVKAAGLEVKCST